MEQSLIQNILQAKFSSAIIQVDEDADVLTITVEKDHISAIILYLKEEQGYTFLTDLCGVHYPGNELPLGVVYHLHDLLHNLRIRLKTFTSIESPEIQSIHEIFAAANWMERETYDFFGIIFTGHPNLIRILNVEYLDYFPLRKEYPLEDPTRTDKDDRFFGR